MASNQVIENEQWIYQTRPGKEEVGSSHYSKKIVPIGELEDGQVLFQTIYWSVDPYQRIQQAASNTWEEPHPLGQVQGSGTVLKVVSSKNPNFESGQHYLGYTGWQKYVVLQNEQLNSLRNLSPLEEHSLPLSYALGILGMPARTAYFGLIEAGKPKVCFYFTNYFIY